MPAGSTRRPSSSAPAIAPMVKCLRSENVSALFWFASTSSISATSVTVRDIIPACDNAITISPDNHTLIGTHTSNPPVPVTGLKSVPYRSKSGPPDDSYSSRANHSFQIVFQTDLIAETCPCQVNTVYD